MKLEGRERATIPCNVEINNNAIDSDYKDQCVTFVDMINHHFATFPNLRYIKIMRPKDTVRLIPNPLFRKATL